MSWPFGFPGRGWLSRRARRRETATELYGAVVARAREPVFYARMGIPDTPEGRYEMIALHLVLALERLRIEGEPGIALSRDTIETFIADMDGSMREMGVGDLTVPKKVKSAAAGLYGRAEAFRRALAEDAERSFRPDRVARPDGAAAHGVPVAAGALPAAIAHFTLTAAPDDPRAGPLAAYYRAMADGLVRLPAAEVLAGRIPFPPLPETPGGSIGLGKCRGSTSREQQNGGRT